MLIQFPPLLHLTLKRQQATANTDRASIMFQALLGSPLPGSLSLKSRKRPSITSVVQHQHQVLGSVSVPHCLLPGKTAEEVCRLVIPQCHLALAVYYCSPPEPKRWSRGAEYDALPTSWRGWLQVTPTANFPRFGALQTAHLP